MFDDPSGAGAALFSAPLSGLASPIRPGFVVAIPSKMKKSACRPACALLLSSATS